MNQSNSSGATETITCGIKEILRPSGPSPIIRNLCPVIVIFLQFSITSMFMWMLCEGIHLNNVLTLSVFKNHIKTIYFHILGWGNGENFSFE